MGMNGIETTTSMNSFNGFSLLYGLFFRFPLSFKFKFRPFFPLCSFSNASLALLSSKSIFFFLSLYKKDNLVSASVSVCVGVILRINCKFGSSVFSSWSNGRYGIRMKTNVVFDDDEIYDDFYHFIWNSIYN